MHPAWHDDLGSPSQPEDNRPLSLAHVARAYRTNWTLRFVLYPPRPVRCYTQYINWPPDSTHAGVYLNLH